MNQALSKKQLTVIVFVLLVLTTLALARYFREPNQLPAGMKGYLLHDTVIESLTIERPPLTPRYLSTKTPDALLATPKPLPTNSAGGGGTGPPMPAEVKERMIQEAQREKKQEADAIAYLKNEGVPVSVGQIPPSSSATKVDITISLQSTGTFIEGRPTWSTFGYQVRGQRTVYLAQGTDSQADISFPIWSEETGIATPETLAKKQDEALGKALEALAVAWKKDNSESTTAKP